MTIPYTFTNGTTADADEVNDNFGAVEIHRKIHTDATERTHTGDTNLTDTATTFNFSAPVGSLILGVRFACELKNSNAATTTSATLHLNGVNLTDVYREHRHDYDAESRADFAGEDHRPLAFRNLTYTRSVEESKELNRTPGPLMIVSASGMMTAGRVIHHLKHTISDDRNAILITGFQAEGTLGRRILEGETRVKLHGQEFEVKAEVMLFNEFSAHADRQELEAYASAMSGLKNIFLVHGESHQADDLKQQLQQVNANWQVRRPDEGDSFEL